MVEHWRVQVDINGEMVLAIESASLAGQDITEEYAAVIRDCAEHLLSFVGRTADNAEAETHPPTGDKSEPSDITPDCEKCHWVRQPGCSGRFPNCDFLPA